MTNPLLALKKNPFVLAPMAGITDHAFRSFMKKRGASVVVTELISATGIQYKSEKTLKLMSFDKDQSPVGIQLFGEEPEQMAEAARFAQGLGCDFIDLNFGCPVPKVTKKGAGSAILKDLPQMTLMLSTIKKAIEIPLTIKIRTGWDQGSRNADEVCKIAYNEGIHWVAIHGRTRAQGYEGLADWDYIRQVKANSPVPVLGNGDIHTAQDALNRLQESKCDGVLIGRGALKNPFIFQQALHLMDGHPNPESLDLLLCFQDLKAVLEIHCDDRILQIQLKKFAAWFATGYPNAALFRKKLFQSSSTPEVLELAKEYFAGLRNPSQISKAGFDVTRNQSDTSKEAFLMGGHG